MNNAKHLFLTLTMLLASITFAWGTKYVDVISYDVMVANYSAQLTKPNNVNTVTGCTFVSDAEYTGYMYYGTDGKIGIFNRSLASTVSGGVIKSVTVNFHSSATSGHGVEVIVGNTAFSGGENKATAEGKALETHTITYDGTNTSVKYDAFGDDYQYIALVGIFSGSGIKATYITSVEIEWDKAVSYTITKGAITGTGLADWDVDIFVDKSTAVKDEVVTITIAPTDLFTSAVSFSVNDMVFDLSCTGYVAEGETYTLAFLMPDESVTISAVFDEIWRDPQTIDVTPTSIAVPSGVERVITFERYESVGLTPITEGTAYYTIADASIADIVIVDNHDGTGTCQITGKKVGSTTMTINAPKTPTVDEGSSTLITITVTPRDVALVAEYSGDYYAMKNTFADHKAGGVKVFYSEPEKKYYYEEGTNLTQLTWNASDPVKNNYHIQNPASSDNYLMWDAGQLDESASSYNWWKNGEHKFINSDEWAIVYNGSVFQASKALTSAAVEALISDFRPMTYTTASGAGIDDARTLSEGKQGTICVPFDVEDLSAAGAEFYELTGKVVDGDKLAAIETSDAVSSLEAGHSYIFKMKAGQSVINLTGVTEFVTTAYDGADGFVGCLPGDAAEKIYVPSKEASYATDGRIDGCYVLSNGALRYVQPLATASVKHYRAYINAKELPTVPPAAVPLRRAIFTEDYDGDLEFGTDEIVTSINELSDPVLINWNEPVYNIMGIRVGKGATGLLIQNGRKFLIQ